MKHNHHSLAYKQQKQPNKTYKDLKQKQKMKIADWMFRETCIYYKENDGMPDEKSVKGIVDRIYEKVKSFAIWVPYDEVYRAYLLKLPHYERRIMENGIQEEKPTKEKTLDTAKNGSSNKRCPVCGRRMKQQFIGLQHCKCGMSWKKDIGFFERTGDMVFALERKQVGNKRKQCPVIRYKE